MLKFRCKNCDQKIGVPEEWASHVVRCPRCRNAIPVPKFIDGVIRTGPAASRVVQRSVSQPPKAPLMPMPPITGKTVAVPHPAVRPKSASKPPAQKGAGPQTTATKSVVAKSKAVAKMDLRTPAEKRAAAKNVPPVRLPATPEPIVTQKPGTQDFSELFAGSGLKGMGSSDIQSRKPEDAGPPMSEMMDSLGGPEDHGVGANATVSEIVKGLTQDAPEPDPEFEPEYVHRDPLIRRVVKSYVISGPHVTNTLARSIGSVAMLIGVVSLSLCVMPRATRLAIPAGAAGLLIAMLGAIVPARRRGTEIALALGGSAVSLTGLVLAMLVATGIVPSAAIARALPVRGGAPAARSGDVEVRVASADIVRPVFYIDTLKSSKTDPRTFLRIGLEIRNLAAKDAVPYKTWGALRADAEPVILSDDEGNQLKLIDPFPAVPPGRPHNYPTTLPSHARGIADVLLFEVPPTGVHTLFLQLPGANVHVPAPFNLQIPGTMLRKQ